MPSLLLHVDTLAYLYAHQEFRLGVKQEAGERLAEKLRNVSPHSAVTYLCLAMCAESRGQHSLALALARRATEANPSMAEAHLLLGKYLIREKRYECTWFSCRRYLCSFAFDS